MRYGWWSPLAVVALLAIHWSAILAHAGSIFCDDSDLCLSKRFLRFGRGLRGEDPYYRITRQFYRLGRAYRPYQDKRFLRFGRSEQPGMEDVYNQALLQLEEPYNRKKRSSDTDSQSEYKHNHAKRSADQSEYHEQFGADGASNAIMKRAVDDDISLTSSDALEKRFMRFGRDFSRNDNEVNKRFMRFGKRLVPVKRFMRFGRNMPSNDVMASMPSASKRFMRFGKRQMVDENQAGLHSVDDVLSLASQLKGESMQKEDLYGMDKRFMRFGKRGDKSAAA